jgi:murein DD-endopeptidase MepM/ murein hydrolase activator NlpD
MLLPAVVLAAALATPQTLPQRPDSVVIPAGDLMRLYTNCDEARWPYGTEERLVPKTRGELDSGVVRRRALEEAWRAWFAVRAGDSIPPTGKDAWRYPLAARGRLLDNFRSPRPGGIHGALDIFAAEATPVLSPVAGVVVAAGDGWQGGYERRGRGFHFEGEGLSRRAGNGVILFDPGSGGFFLFAHLQEGILVGAGDVIAAGAAVGRIGRTGNAAVPGHGGHLHLAFKQAGRGCGVEGVLVPVDPYRPLRAARDRDLPRRAPVRRPASPAPPPPQGLTREPGPA